MTRHLLQNVTSLPLFIHKLSSDYLHLAPAGQLLKNNIIQEWILSNIINTEGNVFPYDLPYSETSWKNLKKAYIEIKELCNNQLPFAISEIKNISLAEDQTKNSSYLNPSSCSRLKCYYFASPQNAYQLFLYCQKQRKIWWRKFAANPGLFSLSDIRTQEQKQCVDILVEFPWGREVIERITYMDSNFLGDLTTEDKQAFEARDGRKKVFPYLIEYETTSEKAVLSYLCDAFEEDPKTQRHVMLFHRKLAPYKTGICLPKGCSNNSELGQLGMLITLQLRKAGISTLSLPSLSSENFEEQLKRFDSLGLPYTCILNEGTLRTGIFGLRNRDTTIKEQVHVSQVVNYMSNLLRNY